MNTSKHSGFYLRTQRGVTLQGIPLQVIRNKCERSTVKGSPLTWGHRLYPGEPQPPAVTTKEVSARCQCLLGGRVALGEEHRSQLPTGRHPHGRRHLGRDLTEPRRDRS